MKALPIILASKSPRRRELLTLFDVPFQVVPSTAREVHDQQLTAWEMAQVNAYRKARAVARRFPDALVIGADTMVYLDRDTRLLGKPTSQRDAAAMLRALAGRVHAVITGVCLLHLRERRRRVFTDWTDVQFHPLTAAQIRAYLRLIDPMDKAGAYAIQEHGDRIIAALFGSYSNVVGLPMERLREELKAFGFFHPRPRPAQTRRRPAALR
ncbi:MAG TPA: Maf family protein [Verrucomicrobiota bacterium]|nr:Maf family protein [Verrucomicrobiota bacterium]HNT14259.1 Maf family protein [Verrucomicrobiota bacterium]